MNAPISTGTAHLTLSLVEFDVCWEVLGLNATPTHLEVPSPGKTWEERRQIVRAVLSGLTARGLARGGAPHPDLESSLGLLAHPDWGLHGGIRGTRQVRAIGAARERQGVVAARRGDEVRLWPAPVWELADQLVGLAGDRPAGPGESVSLRSEVLEVANRRATDARALARHLVAEGEPPGQARALAAMVDGAFGGGHFGAVVPDGGTGRRRGAGRLVAFHDTPGGRYLQLRRRTPSGAEWVTVTPAGNARVATALRELVDEARAD
ncbi:MULTISPECIES: ESX secretion-associated protein EspG [Actinoalloteichus]|uniref:EspG family protein n=1 Tax=Actinoalloteichus caeruleus DSM 43889 TaxID=1120930 RepID=A0ABT1JMA8_ACTCY|nr:ESX secretion-associated protein EspG [Actinoalloteichus caeruleus]MCP2333271.1 EspG family protein [Actinoalloteichus caeruleus DSM 43889]